MPIYEYRCTTCEHRTDIVHGINDPGPAFCPSCGAEGTLRKLFAPPAIHYKGSGWAKKDRGASGGGSKAPSGAGSKASTPDAAASAASTSSAGGGAGTSDTTAADSTPSASGGKAG
jgi:putative FmdB family regulatory protein